MSSVPSPTELPVADATGDTQSGSVLLQALTTGSGTGAFVPDSTTEKSTTLTPAGASGHVTPPTHAHRLPSWHSCRHPLMRPTSTAVNRPASSFARHVS